MAPPNTERIAGVDLGFVMEEISLAQDFELWFGKSVFGGILAEVIQKEHSEHTAVTLVNVLELVAAVYLPDVTRIDREQQNPQKARETFYRFIHNRRCDTNDTDWEIFRLHLSFNIATSCKKLENEKVPELHSISSSTSRNAPTVSTLPIDVRDGAPGSTFSPSSSSSSSSTPLSMSSHEQQSFLRLPNRNGRVQSQQVSYDVENPASAPRVTVDMHRYTSELNEYAALQQEKVIYEKVQLSTSPSSWQCTATFGKISEVGMGRNTTQAKHEASRKICELLDLIVL